MKKLLLLVVLTLPCLPTFILGIADQCEFDEQKRDKLMLERFEQWCRTNGYDLNSMSEDEGETLWMDVWSETDDYESALDSVDAVMSFVNQLKADM